MTDSSGNGRDLYDLLVAPEVAAKQRFDYVIIGSGSAGGVLAARLSEDQSVNVLLVEAGAAGRSISIDMPAMLFINAKRAKYNWKFETVPQPELLGRQLYQPRGKTLGGSSAINAMVYMRGHAEDFNRWAKMGAEGWDYPGVLPYFKRSETFVDGGDPTYRGASGPVQTQRTKIWAPVQEAFMAAAAERGYPMSEDPNGVQQEGFSQFDINVDHGVRASTAHAYLGPAAHRANLKIVAETLCLRLALEGTRAVGVDLATRGQAWTVRVDREVILCAGAAKSPQILMLSGIGPSQHLQAHGIHTVIDLPGVGSNLQDHTEVHLRWRAKRPVTYNRFVRPDRAALAGARWLRNKDGICTTNGFECGAMLRSGESVDSPDLLIHYYPVQANDWRPEIGAYGFSMGLNLERCLSRGTMRLASADPKDPLLIDPRYLTEPEDLEQLIKFVAFGRDLVATRAYDEVRGAELAPGPQIKDRAAVVQWIRETRVSAHHLSGTCRMGTDANAVVTPDGKIRGAEGVRVVDASLMPIITNANLNAPTMMLAERLSDLIRGRPLLPPEDVPVMAPISGGASRF
jgi:choline dehydrogenase